jgi:hypothetical protein
MKAITEKVGTFRQRYERYFPAAFFVGGFVFDVFTLGRIDDLFNIVQQGTYLVIIGVMLAYELVARERKVEFTGWKGKAWEYREFVVHFLFGSLLSAYTLFYFKSASIMTSFAFLVFMVGLLVINEFESFQKLGLGVKFALYSLCMTSYFAYLVPIVLGSVGSIPFLLSLAAKSAIWLILLRALSARIADRMVLRNQILVPGALVQAVFLALYVAQAIPPVPVSIDYLGIYHSIEKENGQYRLGYYRPWWKIWQNGDQSFAARPGDKVYCFVRIFSPTRFRDQVKVRWLFKDRRGWQSSDAIPLEIVGGRNEGFRGFAFKANYQPGDWRVQIETTDGREIGRIAFSIEADASTEPRELKEDQS